MILSPQQKPPLGSVLNYEHPLAKGLVASWLFNEGSGNIVHDYSGNGNHGTIMGVAAQSATSGWQSGEGGSVFANDAVTTYVNCGNPNKINLTAKSFTIIAKIKTPVQHGQGAIFSKAYACYFIINSSSLVFRNSGTTYTASPTQPPFNTMATVAMVLDRLNNTVSLYSNGKLLGNRLNYTDGDLYANESTTIGNLRSLVNARIFSNLSIYNRALSDTEIAYLYAFPYCMFDQIGYQNWMKNQSSAQHYYRQLLAGGY